ncbi:MAG: FkbM family methyltransferase [Chthoniobacteraceae bacterium]
MSNFNILEVVASCPSIKIIDIGAMSIGDEIYTALVQAGLAKIVGFECVQAECDKLNAMSRGTHTYLPHAVGDGRERTFHTCSASMTSSIYEPNTPLLERFQNLANLTQVVSRETIPTVRLDELPEVQGADFLKLDVQGAELDILNGAGQTLADLVVIHTEVEFVPLYKEQPLFAEVDQHLRRAGFVFHKLHSVGERTFKPLVFNNDLNQGLSQMLWGDAVYVRDFMALDAVPAEKLLKMAVILHVVYGSFDLVLQVLRAYDAKANAATASAYFTRLTGQVAPPGEL